MEKTGKEPEQILLRVPPGMRDRIRYRATANRRSMNAEIVHCLDLILAGENENGAAPVAAGPRPTIEP